VSDQYRLHRQHIDRGRSVCSRRIRIPSVQVLNSQSAVPESRNTHLESQRVRPNIHVSATAAVRCRPIQMLIGSLCTTRLVLKVAVTGPIQRFDRCLCTTGLLLKEYKAKFVGPRSAFVHLPAPLPALHRQPTPRHHETPTSTTFVTQPSWTAR
jgi:hypothetical protein